MSSNGRTCSGKPAADPITIELIHNSYLSICEEMAKSLVRSSHSPNIKERRDCSCCLYTASGEMAVQAEHIPVHLGVMPRALSFILNDFSPKNMQPGDIFLVNDPYYGGNHLPDLIVAGPLFLHDDLIGFAASMAHHNDVGGMVPRSMPATSTEIFQEGLRIPPVQLAKNGQMDPHILRIIASNSRTPSERVADLQAQVATIRLAQVRIDELGKEYSAEKLADCLAELLDRSEAAIRQSIAKMPDEVITGETFADFGGDMIPIHVQIRKDGTDLHVSFEGTGPQTKSPFNSCLANTNACVYLAMRIALAEGIASNGGLYRVLAIDAPEGSILNPAYPCAVAASTEVSIHTFEALARAFHKIAPERMLADSGCGGVFSMGGHNPQTGQLFAYGEALGGGLGASAKVDGESAVMPPVSNIFDTPVEAVELSLPLRIESYALVDGSSGDGEHRGGLGLRRSYRTLVPTRCSFQIGMGHKQPGGLNGGNHGRQTHIVTTRPDGTETRITRYTQYETVAGELVTIETAGGGGFGDPAKRDAAAKAADLRNGYTTLDNAAAPGIHP
ncbi:MAG: hydantoinase B/oxoprolinase family protein [Paracoccaceae bacterium]